MGELTGIPFLVNSLGPVAFRGLSVSQDFDCFTFGKSSFFKTIKCILFSYMTHGRALRRALNRRPKEYGRCRKIMWFQEATVKLLLEVATSFIKCSSRLSWPIYRKACRRF